MRQAITDPPPAPWWKRLAWFVGIWAASVAALGLVAFLIRLWIGAD
ncbi:hypothetical protein BSL82_12325 [Tardibacter chloracetimidivorans]|uniref:DUF2474 domain-containing protein n=1 Tax=Tardibacter chloracetimidivorans TaxID=1921510 RepID=A0A1L3ZWL5_9SPHN|nr:DUF2474 domain-containing protein [Tardibacter chloracetimidivorans]API59999.1 hypothetical protein BSL82_12325 [Tardibacter chloracetimidivorans]